MEDRHVTLELPFTRKSFYLACTVVLLAIALWLGVSRGPLYLNNQWKPHRWASDLCRAKGLAPEQCATRYSWRNDVSNETVYFDVCLEHGEMRRIK